MTTRREFLAASAAAVMTGTEALAQNKRKKPGYIDAHSHIWTPDLKKYPLYGNQTVEDLAPRSFTADELLKLVRPHGVQKVVLIQHGIYHKYDNSYLLDTLKEYPGIFSAVAIVDHEQPDVEDEMRRLYAGGFRGFRIHPLGDNQLGWSKHPGMRKIWTTALDLGASVCPLIDAKYLPELDAMCEEFPATQCVIDHFARTGIDGTVHEKDVQNLCRLGRHKKTFVKISAYYALGNKKPPHDELIPMIERCIAAYGTKRLMWASDCPYQIEPPNTYGDSLALITKRMKSLTAADKDQLLRKTAQRVFFS